MRSTHVRRLISTLAHLHHMEKEKRENRECNTTCTSIRILDLSLYAQVLLVLIVCYFKKCIWRFLQDNGHVL